jgi:hypothetical protein
MVILLLRHILHHPGTIPMPSAGWVALLALSSVIGFFCGRLLAGPPMARRSSTTAARASTRPDFGAFACRNFVGLKAAAENYNRDSVLRQLKQLEAEAVPETDEACKSCGSDCRFMTSFGKPGSVGSQETGVRCFEYFVPFSAMDVQKTKDRVLEPI